MYEFTHFLKNLSLPITSAAHFSGLCSRDIYGINFYEIKELLNSYTLNSDNNKIWTLFKENINIGLPSKENFFESLDLPMCRKLKTLLFEVASIVIKKPTNWNVGLFWSEEKGSSLGSHFDDDEVYTIQIFGEKEWIVDDSNISYLKKLISSEDVKPISSESYFSSSETWIKNGSNELLFVDPKRIIMKPGDFLIAPSYALHKVTTVSDNGNLSINMGVSRQNAF